jgi:hypothetical protein
MGCLKLSTFVMAALLGTSAHASGICVVSNSGCKDIVTGVVYVREGNALVDPGTGRVVIKIEPHIAYSPVAQTALTTVGRGQQQVAEPEQFAERGYSPAPQAREVEPSPEPARRKPGRPVTFAGQNHPLPNPGAVVANTGEFLPPAGRGFVRPSDGTYFAPDNPHKPNGYINSRTGEFVPVVGH